MQTTVRVCIFFMKLVSDTHILTYALSLNVKVHFVLSYNPKILKHCVWQAFVHLVRLLLVPLLSDPLPHAGSSSEQTSSCLIHRLFSQTLAFYSDSQPSAHVYKGLPSP